MSLPHGLTLSAAGCRWRLFAFAAALLGAATTPGFSASRPWQELTHPSAAEAAVVFASPPPEYSAQFTWGWHGPVDADVIRRDLDGMKALGVRAAIIEPATGMRHPYLSPEYFDLVRTAVAEARKRDMRLWIMDDGDYPSGLAGGKFTLERPDLRMKAIAAPERTDVAAGNTFTEPIGEHFICAVAVERDAASRQVLEPSEGRITWIAPVTGHWQVVIVRWMYRTMPTRSANNPANVKDTTHSLMDYLDPEAAQQFKRWTFDAYAQAIGPELGRTVLGFRGDEPAYGFNPWTPRLLQEFQQRKGYDLRPYLPAIAIGPSARVAELTDEQRRAYAEYCDVWSDLYHDVYFDLESAWCAEHGVEMQLHVEHEEILPQLAIADGDYFKVFRHIQVPGIDIIWHQLWMDNPADFPKLASSAAHLYGHPRSMCEAFAAYRPPPDLKQARWLLDFLFSRGINRIEYMFWPASSRRTETAVAPAAGASGGPAAGAPTTPASSATSSVPAAAATKGPPGGFSRYYRDPGFPQTAAYVNRLSYLLGEGIPGADIGLYLPSSSFWVVNAQRGQQISAAVLAIAHQLIGHQRDFDFVDDQALTQVLRPEGDTLVNLSGQPYRAIIIPPAAAIPAVALERLQAFVRAGGRVLLLGDSPSLVVGRTFREAKPAGDLSWVTLHEPTATVTDRVLAALPTPDLALATSAPLVSYTHRRLRDADVYFVFNSGDAPFASDATFAGTGTVQVWNPESGTITRSETGAAARPGTTTLPLDIPPWTTRVLVITRQP